MGFLRPVRFDGTAGILVCKSERDLGRVSKLPRGAGVGVSIVREGKRKPTSLKRTLILVPLVFNCTYIHVKKIM